MQWGQISSHWSVLKSLLGRDDDATKGADLVGTTTGTANAAGRTAGAKMREVWSILDFTGADYDTKLDNAMADVEAGTLIYYPPSDTVYDHAGGLILPADKSIELRSHGATLEHTGSNALLRSGR